MAKARRMLEENLKLIDVVVEIVDARAPASSRNPDFDKLFQGKARIVLLNKSDLANEDSVKKWVDRFKGCGILAAPIVSTANTGKKTALELINAAAAPKVEQMKKKGVIKTVRVMVAGIPNVGKSTFINRIAGSNRAEVGDKPGVTKGKQWVKIGPYLELMDTPGLLWPKLENADYARHLAYLGSIKDDIMNVEELAADLIAELIPLASDGISVRYGEKLLSADKTDYLRLVSERRGFFGSGHEPDTERAARIVLDEFRAGRLARVTLDDPEEIAE